MASFYHGNHNLTMLTQKNILIEAFFTGFWAIFCVVQEDKIYVGDIWQHCVWMHVDIIFNCDLWDEKHKEICCTCGIRTHPLFISSLCVIFGCVVVVVVFVFDIDAKVQWFTSIHAVHWLTMVLPMMMCAEWVSLWLSVLGIILEYEQGGLLKQRTLDLLNLQPEWVDNESFFPS